MLVNILLAEASFAPSLENMTAHIFTKLSTVPQRQAPARATSVPVSCTAREPARTHAPCVRSPALHENRRAVLFGTVGAAISTLVVREASATEYTTLYGQAKGPTDYGSQEGKLTKDSAKYSYEYPTTWKRDNVNKVQKGMQGIDTRIINPRVKGMTAFVVTFGRAGEDDKNFKLGDVDATLQGFSGADYDLNDAVTYAQEKSSNKRDADGQTFYDYEIFGPELNYLASVTLNRGKVYALFVKSPAKAYKQNEDDLRKCIETFRTI
ncbi:hypothetical protein WJX74_003444 [Apatococcus lobatus]|uniref:PsbP C-terminal domain-containing protein n=1 Tax=Apatococcus lobatus TaxID=904363 RepID=A0AAW1SAB2_9CHLO